MTPAARRRERAVDNPARDCGGRGRQSPGVKEDEAAFFEFMKSDSFTVDGLKAQLKGHSKH